MILNGVLIAFSTIGIIQWGKNIFNLPKSLSWIWALAMLFVCVLVSAVCFLLPPFVFYGVFAFACTQLFYENIIQIVKNMIENIQIGKTGE